MDGGVLEVVFFEFGREVDFYVEGMEEAECFDVVEDFFDP